MAVTNAVLQERMQQQHTQTMLLLAKVDDKLTKLNGSVEQIQVRDAEHEIRIAKVEECSQTVRTREGKLRAEIEEVRKYTWRIAIAVALIAGVVMSAGERVWSFLLP